VFQIKIYFHYLQCSLVLLRKGGQNLRWSISISGSKIYIRHDNLSDISLILITSLDKVTYFSNWWSNLRQIVMTDIDFTPGYRNWPPFLNSTKLHCTYQIFNISKKDLGWCDTIKKNCKIRSTIQIYSWKYMRAGYPKRNI